MALAGVDMDIKQLQNYKYIYALFIIILGLFMYNNVFAYTDNFDSYSYGEAQIVSNYWEECSGSYIPFIVQDTISNTPTNSLFGLTTSNQACIAHPIGSNISSTSISFNIKKASSTSVMGINILDEVGYLISKGNTALGIDETWSNIVINISCDTDSYSIYNDTIFRQSGSLDHACTEIIQISFWTGSGDTEGGFIDDFYFNDYDTFFYEHNNSSWDYSGTLRNDVPDFTTNIGQHCFVGQDCNICVF